MPLDVAPRDAPPASAIQPNVDYVPLYRVQPTQWAYDLDPTTGQSRASYPGIVFVGGNPVGGPVTGSGAQVLQTSPTINTPILNGGSLAGTFSGAPTWSGSHTFSAIPPFHITGAAGTTRAARLETAGVLRINFGLDSSAESGANAGSNFVINTFDDSGNGLRAPALTLTRSTGVLGVPAGFSTAASLTAGTSVISPFFTANQPTITLSGSTVTKIAALGANWLGSSTIVGNTTLANTSIGGSSDNASIPNGSRLELLITNSYGGNNYNGGRGGVGVQMSFNAASTLTNAGFGGVGHWSVVAPSANMGGTSGTNRIGSYFGSNFWARAATGATWTSQIIGQEINASVQTGADTGRFVLQQIIITSDHATHGAGIDSLLVLGSQVGAAVGVRNLITAGDYSSQWPVDPNGGLFLCQSSQNNVATTAAYGFDTSQVAFSGTSPEGSNFSFRGPGTTAATAIDGSGGVKVGTGYISASASGLSIDAPLWVLSGTPTIGAGGTGYAINDVVVDGLGNTFVIATAPGGIVGSVTVKARAEGNTSNQSGTIATTARVGIGAGLTLTETWVQHRALGFFGATPVAKPTVTGSKAANAALTSLLTALANLGILTDSST